MKLTGIVSNVERTIAKHIGDGIEEKRKFQLNIRPASKSDMYLYGYGSFSFTVHGQELQDLGLDLGDDVEVVVHKAGDTYEGKDLEDARHRLYLTEQALTGKEVAVAQLQGKERRANERAGEANIKSQALQLENVRLLTELITLKAMLQPGNLPPMLERQEHPES